MQLARILKLFLFFLKYKLSEAHIGLMKQVQFLNWFKLRRKRQLVNINWEALWVRRADKMGKTEFESAQQMEFLGTFLLFVS